MPEKNRPDFEKLADYAEGRLPEAEAAAIARQIEQSDDETRSDARWLAAFTRISGELALDSPPARVRRDLEAAFDERFAVEEKPRFSASGLFEKITASLTFDSDSQAAFGVRSAGMPSSEAQRQLAYETRLADISVSIQPRPGAKFDLLGQVLPTGDEDPEDFTVQLVEEGVEVGITAADDLGEFTFAGIGSGSYRIIFATPEAEISTPEFTL